MKKTSSFLGMIALAMTLGFLFQSCKKKSDSSSSNSSAAVALSIQTGAQTMAPGGTMTYKAVLVDKNGNTSAPSSVTWSVASTGSSSIGSFNGNGATTIFTAAATGSGIITASATVNGTTLSASVPVGIYSATLFTVVPSAVIWTTGAGSIPLTPVYIGTSSTGYTYASSDASIASVDATGNITFNKAGSCTITVTATGISGNPAVEVPVLVTGTPTASLPVSRIAVSPSAAELFRGENATLTAKAYNTAGSEVSTSFSWSVQDPSVATVDASGKITAVSLGKTVVTAIANGITGQAEIDVLPDTAIILTPYMATIMPSASQQMTATTYVVNHTDKSLSLIPNPALNWTILTYGIPMFDIATVNASGLVSMNATATPGISTVVMAAAASPTIQPGVALIMAGF